MPAPLYEEIYSRTLLTPIALAALPYRWMANPYRGCQHACGYCYARGSHQAPAQPGLEQPFGVKVNAAAVLREELAIDDATLARLATENVIGTAPVAR